MVMMLVYTLSGYYNEVFRKSRLQEFFVTISSALVNSLIIFLVALVNDMANDRAYNYEMILLLVMLLYGLCISIQIAIDRIIATLPSKLFERHIYSIARICRHQDYSIGVI